MYLFWNQNTKTGTHWRNKIYGNSSLKLLLSVAGGLAGLHPQGQAGTGPGVCQVWGRRWLWLSGGGPQGVQLQRGLWFPHCTVEIMLFSQAISTHKTFY